MYQEEGSSSVTEGKMHKPGNILVCSLIMNESVFESFPDDVMVSELSGSRSTGCEYQRELSYSQ